MRPPAAPTTKDGAGGVRCTAGRGIRCSKDHPSPNRHGRSARQFTGRDGDTPAMAPRSSTNWESAKSRSILLTVTEAAVGRRRMEVRVPLGRCLGRSRFRRAQASRLDFVGGLARGGIASATGSVPRRELSKGGNCRSEDSQTWGWREPWREPVCTGRARTGGQCGVTASFWSPSGSAQALEAELREAWTVAA